MCSDGSFQCVAVTQVLKRTMRCAEMDTYENHRWMLAEL